MRESVLYFLSALFKSLTLSAYRRVFSACSQQLAAGDTFAIIVVLLYPTKESLRTWVNLDPRKGVWLLPWSRARIHSLRASKDLLISAPSFCVFFSFLLVSAPRSEPAKSMKEILLKSLLLCLNYNYKIAWDLELSALAPVTPHYLKPSPLSSVIIIFSTLSTSTSVRFTMLTLFFASSLQNTSYR